MTALTQLRRLYENMRAAYPLAMAGKTFEAWRAEITK